jgi:hypothetical protein
MSELEKTSIQLARKYLGNHEDLKALECYLAAEKENAFNDEAKFWIYAADWKRCIDEGASASEKWTTFKIVSGALNSAIREIANSEGEEIDKLFALIAFVYRYKTIAAYAVQAQIAAPKERIEHAVLTMYWTGNAIEEHMGSNEEAMKMACELWKEGVKLQRKFYAYSYNGEKAEDYAAKIQKVEPGYVMPSKAGCISKG